MEPDSNQQSSTSLTRRIVDLPVGSSGFGLVSLSMPGLCRSVGRTPKSRSISSRDPYTSVRGWSGSSLRQTGMGEPQNRFLLIDQSRAFSSHLPNWPCLTCSGTQVICSFSSTIRSLNVDTATNQLDTAL